MTKAGDFPLEREVVITVKAYPNPSQKYQETVCVAGVTKEEGWVRLYPISFRHLPKGLQFKKYQIIRLKMRKHEDTRPESFRPDQQSFRLDKILSTAEGWRERKNWLLPTVKASMCEILALQRETGVSLGMFKPKEICELVVEKADREWNAIINQLSLFENPGKPLELIPFRFKYKYVCDDPHCKGHEQSIIDWEACELYRKLRESEADDNALWDKMRRKWIDELWGQDKDSYLFVGNQRVHPRSFLVLGVFWPPHPKDSKQIKLL
ncbi:MAG: hypothetical protein WAO21_05985 [Verrucomicrobiia bacterium]|jgi:hypothetical protein